MPTNPTDDVIERAEGVVMRCCGFGEKACVACKAIADTLDYLRTARADTRRLDWLARTSGVDFCSPVKDPHDGTWWVYGADDVEWTGGTIREVIDAAIAAEEG